MNKLVNQLLSAIGGSTLVGKMPVLVIYGYCSCYLWLIMPITADILFFFMFRFYLLCFFTM